MGSGRHSTFLGRRRGVASGAALSLASASVVVLAFNAQGSPAQHVALNDGGVWVTSAQLGPDPSAPRGAFARLNKPIGAFDGSFFPPGAAQTSYHVDVFQGGTTVLARDLAAGKLYRVSVETQIADPSGSLAVPAADSVALGGSTVAVVDPGSGKAWVRDVGTLASFTVDGKPDAVAGGGAAVAVAQDGTAFVASAAKHELLTIRTSTAHAPAVTMVALPSDLQNLAVTAVGTTPVVLDQTSGAVFVPGGSAATVSNSGGGPFVLQQVGPTASTVLVANGKTLFGVSLRGSTITTLSTAGTGQPAAPVRLESCIYGAWAGGAGELVRACGTQQDTYPLANMGSVGSLGLVFRVNGNVVVLNAPATGAVDDVTAVPLRVDNWDDVKPATVDTTSGAQALGKQASATSANHLLTAQADTLGARPGRVTVLHVLDNDSAPDNDVLAVASVTSPDVAGVTATVTPDGQAVAVNVPPSVSAGEVHFRYTVSDDKGQTSSAPVTVQIRAPGDNDPPKQRFGLVAKQWNVAPSGVFSYPVLSDWRDFDGDSLVLTSATVDSGSVSATADGRLTFIAPATSGPQQIKYTVGDGIGDQVPGTLDVNVLAPNANPIPATPEPDVVRTFVGQQVTISPLANDIAGADPSNPQARLTLSGTIASPAGATVSTDAAAGLVTFVASQAGTYPLTYQAAFGSAKTAAGQIRVDVEPKPTTQSGPVAMPDVAVLKGQQPATVDVLANDSDPSGALLTVESAAPVDAQSGLQVSVVQGRWLRIVATKPSIGGPRIVTYQVTDGTTPPVTGDVTVTQLPAATSGVPPIAEDDTAVVRAGDVVSVNVLANDTDPNGGPLTLVQGALPSRPQLGGAYASGSVVRYAAPATVPTATFVVVDYVVQNSNGDSATGHVDITVNPIDAAHDAPPKPGALEARVAAGGTVTINVPIYNVDPDGDSVTVTGIPTAPQLGQIVSFARDSITYKAYAQSAGTDAFQYQVQDRFGQLGTAQIRVAVVPGGTPQSPVAVDDVLTSAPGANLHIDVLANDLIAPGDQVTIEPLAHTNTTIPVGASLQGTLIVVRAPEVGAAPLVLSYGITDGTGAVSVAQVTVRAKAGFDIPPIARDDSASPLPATGSTVTVDVTANDDDPQGSRADLKVTKVFDPQVVISGNSLVIPIQTYAQTIGYQISDPAGSAAMAVVHVPGRVTAAGPPKLKPDVQPIAISQGGQKTIALADYVIDPRGKSVRLTTNDKISGSPADALQATSQGGASLVLHSVGTYSGPATVAFEVTDGTNLSDPAGLKAVLTIPVTIGSAPATLKCPATPVNVTAGGSPATIDLTSLCQAVVSDPTQLAALKFSSTLSALPGVKLTTSGSAGEQLQLAAAAAAKPNTTGTITVQIAGTAAQATLNVAVVAAPLATVQNIAVGGVKAGQTATIDVASYVQSPFGSAAVIQVLGVKQTSTSSPATTAVSGTKVSVTPAATAHGTFTFIVSVTDLASEPARTVQGTITMEVLGVPDPPGTPTLTSVASHTVVLAFSPAATNGAPIDKFAVADSSGKAYDCATAPCTVTGLTNGQAYTFTARAHNEVGWSTSSPQSQPATPDQVPDPVSGLAAVAGDTTAALQWTAGHVDGTPITVYDVQISPDPGNGPTQKVTAPGTTLKWSGLTNGTQYTFQVRAENAAGAGQFGTPAQVIPFGTPKTMAAPTATPADSAQPHEKAITVTWAAADGNGRDITSYTVTQTANTGPSSPQTIQAPLTQATFTVASDGTGYQYSVTATNAGALTSLPSPLSTSVNAIGTPDAIGTVTASDHANGSTNGYDHAIHVAFTLPNANGKTLTVNYALSTGQTGSWAALGAPGTQVEKAISGLPNDGNAITASLTPCNEGPTCGPASISNAATPYGPVGAPQNVAVSQVDANTNSLVVSWNAVPQNGRAITRYTVSGGGSCSVAGTSCRFDNLPWGTSQTFSVTATDSAGEISGAGSASGSTPPQPPPPVQPSIAVGPGIAGTAGGCPSGCHWVNFTLSNFAANSTYVFSCIDNGATYWSGHTITTNGSGSASLGNGNGFDCIDGFHGHTISVSVNGVTGSFSPWP